MASIDELLNDLTNKELRTKCKEYGLPDVPVTDTSRTVLLRRLKAAMTGELPKKTTNKRETMHVTPLQSLREQEKPSKKSPQLQKRHTIAAAEPLNNSRSTVQARQAARKSEVTVEDVYDDDNDYYARNNNHSYQSNNSYGSNDSNYSDTSSRRSVSLSKSGVLTTSFVTETVPARKYDEDMEVDDESATDEEDEGDTEEDDQPEFHYTAPKVSTITHNKSRQQPINDNHRYNGRDSNQNRKQEGNNRYHYSDVDYSRNTAYDEPARYSYAAADVQRTLPKLRQTNVQNLNIGSGDDYPANDNNNILYRNTAAENAALSYTTTSNSPPLYPFDLLNSTASSAEIDEPATRPYLRRSVVTGGTTAANVTRTSSDPYEDALKRSLYFSPATAPNQRQKRVSFHDEDANDYEEDDLHYEEDEVGEEHVGAQHYVSSFARNLENSSSPIDGQVYRPKARRSLEKQRADDNSIMRAAHDFLRAIDEKYHITRYLSITAVILIVIFILVCILP